MTNSESTLDRYRRWGFLQASLDPLGFLKPLTVAELDTDGEAGEQARRWYCGTIGAEFMHIPDPFRREWVQRCLERPPGAYDRAYILDRLISAQTFEQVLQRRYPGTKRYSLEGLTALIPLLDEILHASAENGVAEAVIGMSHRGRLNVMAHIVGTPPADIFAEFEDVDPRSVLGGGDVKYHIGATGLFTSRGGRPLQVRIVSGPSHLEAVDPVLMGRVRAKQTRIGAEGPRRVLPILIHGDAALAGQGIASEALNLANLNGFSVGGTIHIVADNLIGFTARPRETYSSRFSTDVVKRLPAPIFHVNAEDPGAVVRLGAIAAAYRATFAGDVVVDLIGYRRHGHSEVDDPTMTQPVLYEKIAHHPLLWQKYAQSIPAATEERVAFHRKRFEDAMDAARSMTKMPRLSVLPDYWNGFHGGPYQRARDPETRITPEEFTGLLALLSSVPDGFTIHPKVMRVLERRVRMTNGEVPVDFGTAELVAFGSLLRSGMPVRLSGQDARRATFAQRHAVYVDTRTLGEYTPLAHVHPAQGRFEIYNSMLSEAAVLGFEYGFSRDYPEALVLWEAQFGDFANGAQVIIDQFITAGEDKWGLLSGLVLLLPHGYEGQGPEHSSARLERFLQLAAEDNIQVCQPSTAAQYFHLLRRQALSRWRKPLIVLTPKSMLRLPDACSKPVDFTSGRFLHVLPENEVEDPERVLLCSGKISHALRAERARRQTVRTAIVAVEQLYPFPGEEIAAELSRFPGVREAVWVQEEPANMGALTYIVPALEKLVSGVPLRSVRRSASASPATGSAKAHEVEQR
ncbi:MAG TPA: 2-oxoglutarate dehydrogenase E1 component, partial [Bacteroidota bacterium]|nr:2-oxoglutarate dehydrogenase E1 component [Bacteroidota bacterium]